MASEKELSDFLKEVEAKSFKRTVFATRDEEAALDIVQESMMKLAEKFNVPVVTLIDTPGASPGLEAEERGQGEAIAKNLMEMSVLRVPVICIVIGEGASGGALGIG